MRDSRGFTLLEVLVATTIMGIAVAGLLSTMSGSLRNAASITDHDRAVLLARSRMDEILADRRLPHVANLEGPIDPVLLGGAQGGWRARLMPFEAPPHVVPGVEVLDRVELEIWWTNGEQRRSFVLTAYRPYVLKPSDVAVASP